MSIITQVHCTTINATYIYKITLTPKINEVRSGSQDEVIESTFPISEDFIVIQQTIGMSAESSNSCLV